MPGYIFCPKELLKEMAVVDSIVLIMFGEEPGVNCGHLFMYGKFDNLYKLTEDDGANAICSQQRDCAWRIRIQMMED